MLVRDRAQGCCEYCLSQESHATQGFSVEHIARSMLGARRPRAISRWPVRGAIISSTIKPQLATLSAATSVPLFHPRRDHWYEHFIWNHDCTLIVGLTPTGRATIEALHLNREGVVNLRRLLLLAGKHPPTLHSQA